MTGDSVNETEYTSLVGDLGSKKISISVSLSRLLPNILGLDLFTRLSRHFKL